jgi:chromate transporter
MAFAGAGPLGPTVPTGAPPTEIPFEDAVRVWVRVGLQSFGGPAGQIAVMHRVLVDEKRWVSEHRFLHALNYCMMLPGPEAQQLAIYLGWLLHGYAGGLVAGSLFVLPGAVAILMLSYAYAAFQGAGVVAALFFGLKAAVLAVVVEAVIRIGRRVLKNAAMVAIAALAFIGIFLFQVPFPLIVLGAGFVGFIGGSLRPSTFVVIEPKEAAGEDGAVVDQLLLRNPDRIRPSFGRALRVLAVCSLLWLGPITALAILLGPASIYVQVATFFSKAATVTFGGAYAVLAYIAQQAVDRYGWLRAGEMLDGLAMAETTPGPLIMVVQFVGFMGAYRNPGTLDPFIAGTLGAILTTWVTFLPCFLWIFLGAPYIERLRGNRMLSAALSAITAAVVGVILNLAVWFAVHVLFGRVEELHLRSGMRLLVPDLATVDAAALSLSVAAFIAMLRFRIGMLPVLGAAMVLGIALRLWLG